MRINTRPKPIKPKIIVNTPKIMIVISKFII